MTAAEEAAVVLVLLLAGLEASLAASLGVGGCWEAEEGAGWRRGPWGGGGGEGFGTGPSAELGGGGGWEGEGGARWTLGPWEGAEAEGYETCPSAVVRGLQTLGPEVQEERSVGHQRPVGRQIGATAPVPRLVVSAA